MEQTALSVTEIRIDGGTQMREKLCHDTAERYAEHMRDGDEFPPVTVFFDGSAYWLADGFHRCEAAKQAGVETVPGDVRQGSRLDAIKYACRANDSNGLSRTKGDLAKSYVNAVQFELVEATDVQAVKELLRCSSRAARTLTKPARDKAKQERDARIVELSEDGKSQREIAEDIGVDQKTVSNTLKSSEEKRNNAKIPQAEEKRNDAKNGQQSRPEVIPSQEDEHEESEDDFDPVEQMASDLQEALEDNKRMGAIFDADDRLAAAMAEVTRLTAVEKIHNQTIARLTNECNQAKRHAKSWMNKYKKLEKEVGRNISADDFEEA